MIAYKMEQHVTNKRKNIREKKVNELNDNNSDAPIKYQTRTSNTNFVHFRFVGVEREVGINNTPFCSVWNHVENQFEWLKFKDVSITFNSHRNQIRKKTRTESEKVRPTDRQSEKFHVFVCKMIKKRFFFFCIVKSLLCQFISKSFGIVNGNNLAPIYKLIISHYVRIIGATKIFSAMFCLLHLLYK